MLQELMIFPCPQSAYPLQIWQVAGAAQQGRKGCAENRQGASILQEEEQCAATAERAADLRHVQLRPGICAGKLSSGTTHSHCHFRRPVFVF